MSSVNLADIAAGIPKNIRNVLSTELTDILLNAKGGDKLPASLARSFLYLWQRNMLEENEGIKVLLEAALTLDAEATTKKLKELNLSEAAVAIEKAQKG